MKYNELSDFEINCLVAERLGWEVQREFLDGNIGFTEDYHCKYPHTIWALNDDLDGWGQFCFTSSGEDAFPIIFDNRIGLHPNDDGSYKAFMLLDKDNYASETDSGNPLRAAMIEYLKIREEK